MRELAHVRGKYFYDAHDTTTKQAFLPGHLSRLPLGPGQKVAFVPGPTASRASRGTGVFYPGWWLQPGQKGWGLLSRLVDISMMVVMDSLRRPPEQYSDLLNMMKK